MFVAAVAHVLFQSTRPARGATGMRNEIILDGWFQSTRPARGATSGGGGTGNLAKVSIHAPRAGRDFIGRGAALVVVCFNPRAPRGARHAFDVPGGVSVEFQSTRPARGATVRA